MSGTTRARGAIATAGALALLLACSGPNPEEQLASAHEKVVLAEKGVAEAQQRVEREEGDLEQAQSELADAARALGEAEERLADAKEQLAEVADDTYLFRAVQTALLAEPALEGHAIGARVRDRVVTLEGSVPTLELRKKAGAVASNTIGVERVDNEVTVEPPADASP
jgi:osmotically-inducible protein OsmY